MLLKFLQVSSCSSLLKLQLVGGYNFNMKRNFDSKWFILTPLLVIISVTMMIVFFRKILWPVNNIWFNIMRNYSVYTYSSTRSQSDDTEGHFNPKHFYTVQEVGLRSYPTGSSMSSSSYYDVESVRLQGSIFENTTEQ